MKQIFTIIGGMALALTATLLVLQTQYGGAAPVQLISDMAYEAPAIQKRLAPPPGAIYFGEPLPPRPADTLFLHNCSACHGASGNGQSYVSQYPGMPTVGNLTTTTKTTHELLHSLQNGRGAMPAFRNRLRPQEAEALINHIHTQLKKQ